MQWTVLVASIWLWNFTSKYTFSSLLLFGEQMMTQHLFSRDLPYFVIPCDMSLIQTLGLLVQFQLVSQAIQLNKESGPGIRAWLKHFKLMYHFGFNFLYCSMNVRCEPNNVILNPLRKRWRCFPKCRQNIKDLNEMEGVMIRLYILSCILHLLIYWVMITYWMHCAFNLLSV